MNKFASKAASMDFWGMTRESGSFAISVEFHSDRPTEKDNVLAETSWHQLVCKFTEMERGRLSFTLSDLKGEVFTIRTQRFKLDKPGSLFLVANWTADEKCIYVNGEKLLPAETTEEIALISPTAISRIVDGPISFQRPESKDACSFWIDWRRENYGTAPGAPRPGRLQKTFPEQVAELQSSQLLIRDLISRAETGADYVTGAIAAELRALVCWTPQRNRNYKPLLLRLAARRNLPLPVWAFVVREYAEKPLEKVGSFSRSMAVFHLPDIRKTYGGQKLIDLQAWLDDPFQLNADGEGKKEFGKVCVTHRDLIIQIASIIGNSHYDEDIPVELDTFRHFLFSSQPLMTQILVHVAKSVHDLVAYFILEDSSMSDA